MILKDFYEHTGIKVIVAFLNVISLAVWVAWIPFECGCGASSLHAMTPLCLSRYLDEEGWQHWERPPTLLSEAPQPGKALARMTPCLGEWCHKGFHSPELSLKTLSPQALGFHKVHAHWYCERGPSHRERPQVRVSWPFQLIHTLKFLSSGATVKKLPDNSRLS